jgi:signal transduction histidine kinase
MSDAVSRTEEEPTERSLRDREPADPSGVAARLAALEHELRLRDEFISTAAHELRNPLSPAYMQLEHMKEVVAGSAEPIAQPWLLHQLAAVTARFDRFLDTLNRILDASRLGEGHLVLLPEPCDLVDVATGVLAATEPELRASQTPVRLDAPAPVTGWWDRMRLEQIVGNLVSNAARYGAGRPICVEIMATPDTARLTVRDHGIGIAADDLSRIFQRFERARNVGRSAGFGIGLWIVMQLCHAMGGTIDVESELGHGTTFTVALPRTR